MVTTKMELLRAIGLLIAADIGIIELDTEDLAFILQVLQK
jgi:hypothetical protein